MLVLVSVGKFGICFSLHTISVCIEMIWCYLMLQWPYFEVSATTRGSACCLEGHHHLSVESPPSLLPLFWLNSHGSKLPRLECGWRHWKTAPAIITTQCHTVKSRMINGAMACCSGAVYYNVTLLCDTTLLLVHYLLSLTLHTQIWAA